MSFVTRQSWSLRSAAAGGGNRRGARTRARCGCRRRSATAMTAAGRPAVERGPGSTAGDLLHSRRRPRTRTRRRWLWYLCVAPSCRPAPTRTRLFTRSSFANDLQGEAPIFFVSPRIHEVVTGSAQTMLGCCSIQDGLKLTRRWTSVRPASSHARMPPSRSMILVWPRRCRSGVASALILPERQ